MTSLADKAILSGADNRPQMLEKDMYDSWKSRMELYMLNRQHGQMILKFVKNGPLLWPTVEENRVTRPKKYSELSAMKAIQADCDERIQMLMKGTSLTKQEMECKLYDEFDKFAYKKGESLRDFYLRFSLLLNDMNIYNMKLEQFQVNTKFLNTLPPEWSKFVTDVKLVRDLHTTNVDQLHAYLGQHEYHANEVRLMHELHQQSDFSQPDTGLVVPVFQKGDVSIDAINHMKSFLIAIVTSRYPPTNNQLRNSSNPRQQATINNERVTIQPIQGRKKFFDCATVKQVDYWFKFTLYESMNQNFFEPNPCYEPNSSSFDQYHSSQSSVTPQLPQRSNEDVRLEMAKLIKNNRILLNNNDFPHEEAKEIPELMCKLLEDVRNIRVELAKSSDAITTVLPIEKPEYSLSMRYKHLSTIMETESNKVTESSAKNLLPISSEYEVTFDDESEYDVPVKDNSSPVFTTFSNPLFDCNDDFTSSDDESLSDEDVPIEDFKVYSNLIFDDEEINSDETNPHCFNVESDFVESLSNHDTLFDSSLKFNFLEEFSGVLMPTSIADEERIRREHEEYIFLMEKLFTINPFPRPLENFQANKIVETLPTSPISVEDNDSQREEIDIFTDTDDLLPPGIESDDYDLEGDIHVLEELLVNDSISIPKNELSDFDHQDDLLFPRPPLKPPDVEFDFEPNSREVISVVMNNIDELNENECFDPGGEINVFANVKDDD
uniref:Integrase, catalytic region, zinc finger, CCHC-type, peptidase aspartic, catalytic n=1 Tax=Tanacetum cinerariifolium TaxID=118510 RepID=A0A699H0X3_TANCI|nr:hypothetical protein [Tanacetum cinerariifolium]